MRVAELIVALKKCDPDLPVVFRHDLNGESLQRIWDIDNTNYATYKNDKLIDRYKLNDDDLDSGQGTEYCVVVFTE